jgi:tyrosine-specific transport protein
MKFKGSVFGGVLLISGTCIGAGMLGLPVMTAAAGFYPTLGAFLLVWFFMLCSALAYLEVSLRFKGDTNLISMAGHTIGHIPKMIAWVIFVLFLYSLMAAYTAGGTTMLAHILGWDIQGPLHLFLIALLFVLPFALLVYLGTLWVDRLNRLLMFGFIAAFLGLCVLAFNVGPAAQFNPLGSSKYLLFTFPILVTSFGYQLLIPSLKSYLHEDIKKLRLTIIFGSLMPLIVYAVWQLIIIHLIPTWGETGLVSMLNSKVNPADAITDALAKYGESVLLCEAWFAFFALTTSFMGVGLGIFDFFSDALKISKNPWGRIRLCVLTFVPPILYTMFFPQGFLMALTYAGVFATVLIVIYPVIMAWSARYIKKVPGEYQMFGGKFVLILTLLFGVFVIATDVLQQLKLLPIPHN